jgi:hypothetical protein
MSTSTLLIWGLGTIAALGLLYGLGWLSFRRPGSRGPGGPPPEKPAHRGGGGGGFMALQEIIEPKCHHVFIMQDEPMHSREDDAGSPPLRPGRVDFRPADKRRELGS